jgi:hypothetical protein
MRPRPAQVAEQLGVGAAGVFERCWPESCEEPQPCERYGQIPERIPRNP